MYEGTLLAECSSFIPNRWISEGFEQGTRHKGLFGAVMFNPIAQQMNSVRSLKSPYFSSEPWLGIKKDRDPGCKVTDQSRHSASKSQDLEAIRSRGVPIIVPWKNRLELTVGPSVTLVEVWKAKWPCRVGRWQLCDTKMSWPAIG